MMSNKVKFHLVASIANLCICILAMYISFFYHDMYDKKFGIRAPEVYYILQNLYLLIFFWVFTFSIYFIKNAKKHFLLFLLISFLIFTIMMVKQLFDTVLDVTFELIFSMVRRGLTDVFVFLLIVILGMHYSQIFIGKKLMSELYKPKVQ